MRPAQKRTKTVRHGCQQTEPEDGCMCNVWSMAAVRMLCERSGCEETRSTNSELRLVLDVECSGSGLGSGARLARAVLLAKLQGAVCTKQSTTLWLRPKRW
eukprot:989856-Rhodomonas_salina.2